MALAKKPANGRDNLDGEAQRTAHKTIRSDKFLTIPITELITCPIMAPSNLCSYRSRVMADGILTDNTNLVLLFYLAQLFLRELIKSYRLLQVVPMDMSSYYGKYIYAL